MVEEKYIGKAKMKNPPSKPLSFKLKEKSVKNKHLDDKSVTEEKIADGAVGNQQLAEGSVSWDKADDNLKNIITTSGGQHGIPLATEFGDSNLLGITQKILTESRDDIQSQINAIVAEKAQVVLSADPTVVFVGTESSILLAATTNTEASSIVIKKGDTVLATGSGNSLTVNNTIMTIAAGNIPYTADFVIAGLSRSTTKNVQAVYPIRVGSGAAYVDGTPLTTPKTSPAGTYNVVVANNGDYVYFNVPSTMTIHGATMSGFDFPLEAPQTVEIEGVSYKSYRSSNTYDAGTLTIVIS